MTVQGTTTTQDSETLTVSAHLIEVNTGLSGANSNDSGLVIERGSTGDNAIFVWDESADKFIVGTTTATSTSTGNLTITTGTLVANLEGNVTGTLQTAAQGNITSLGTLTTLTVDNVIINGSTIGHTGDTDLMTVASGVLTVAGEVDATSLDISGDADIDGTTNLDAVDIDGAVQIDATVTVGVDDTGYDVKFFGATSGAYMQWDESEDDLIIGGAGRIVVPEGQLVLGSATVDATAAELNLLDGVSGLVQADFTKLAAVNSSSTELNLLDGSAASSSSVTIADADVFLMIDATDNTTKQIPASDISTYAGGGITVKEETSTLTTAATTLKFVGDSVTATGSGVEKTITITDDSLINAIIFG